MLKNTLKNNHVNTTIDSIKASLNLHLFIKKEPIVISINGGWGEGKTYFWKQYIKDEHKDKKVAYVSIFGAENIKEIRQRVITAIFLTDERLLETENFKRTKAIYKKIRDNGSKLVDMALSKIGLPDGLATQLIESQLLTTDWVICFDDIERNSTIKIESILGYIDELREEHGLKVVLIYNINKFKDDKVFNNYHEKVIDRSLPFHPDLEDQIKRVFKDFSFITDNPEFLSKLTNSCHVIGFKNIRLLKKSKQFLQDVIDSIPDKPSDSFLHNLIYSIILFVWIKYGVETSELPDFNFVKNYSSVLYQLEDNDLKAEIKTAYQKIHDFGYQYTDDIDLLLIDYIETDILDINDLKRLYVETKIENSKGKVKQKFIDAWQDFFFMTYRDNSDDFIFCINEATINYMEFISIFEIDDVIDILRKLESEDLAKELWGKFCEIRKPHITNYDNTFGNKIKTKEINSLIKELDERTSVDDRSLDCVIKSIFDDNFIHTKDAIRLSKFSPAELVEYFMGDMNPEPARTMNAIFKRSISISNPDDSLIMIKDNFKKAAILISETNNINKVRLERSGLI